jgi:hypothetical protein
MGVSEALEVPGDESDMHSTSSMHPPNSSDLPSCRGGKGWAKARQMKTMISNLRLKPNLIPKGQTLIKPLVVAVHTTKYGSVLVVFFAFTIFAPVYAKYLISDELQAQCMERPAVSCHGKRRVFSRTRCKI